MRLANNLISHNILRSTNKKPLEAFKISSGSEVIRLLPICQDFNSEASMVAQDIINIHYDHLDRVAILARSRRLLQIILEELKHQGIKAVISQRQNEFFSYPIRWLYSVLRLSNDRQNLSFLDEVIGLFKKLSGIEVDEEEVITIAKTSSNDVLAQFVTQTLKNNLNESHPTIAKGLFDLAHRRDHRYFIQSAFEWFKELESSFEVEKDHNGEVFKGFSEELQVWKQLTLEIGKTLGNDVPLEAFIQEMQIRSKEPSIDRNTIVLMTIHGAKGKEFDHVYIVGLIDDELPSYQSKKKGDNSPEMEEERRNCFVAITRTIKSLTLSYSQSYKGWPKEPSRFLYEMGLLSS